MLAARRVIDRARLVRAIGRGLTIGENFTSSGTPHFGSEPYLISIANNVSIASGVQIITHDASVWHLQKIGLLAGGVRYGRITIHDDCGVGVGAIILPGVSIGPRSIVGAGAVVRRDVPPDTVVFGNPARFSMSLQGFIQHLHRTDAAYDREAYLRNPVVEILRIYPPSP